MKLADPSLKDLLEAVEEGNRFAKEIREKLKALDWRPPGSMR